MIRAIRFASALDFTIEEGAWQAIAELKDTIALASRDRLYEESIKLVFCGSAEEAIGKLVSTGLFEVMEVSPPIKELILQRAQSRDIKKKALEQGMITLRRSGLIKIKAGITSIEEVVRETVRD